MIAPNISRVSCPKPAILAICKPPEQKRSQVKLLFNFELRATKLFGLYLFCQKNLVKTSK